MFIIQNITSRDVVIDDLRVVLGPKGKKDKIDLDKVAPRVQIESSHKLRSLVLQKRVKVIAKDLDTILTPDAEDTLTDDLAGMEKRLKTEIRHQVQTVLKNGGSKTAAPTPEPSPDISTLNDTIRTLIAQLKAQPATNSASSRSEIVKASTDDGISDDIASKIHARAVKRIEQQVTGHVEHEHTTVKNDDLHKNISELENLL